MAYVAPSTQTTGTLITASIWNQDVVANMIAIKTGTVALDLLAVTGLATLNGGATLVDQLLTRPEIKDYSETKTAPTISGGTLTINLENGNHFAVALNANITTLTISNPPSTGRVGAFVLYFTADGTLRTISWPAAVKWASASAPTMTSTNGKIDVFAFVTYDGGTSWYASFIGQNF